MKIKIIILGTLVAALALFSLKVSAQSPDSPPVKIIPAEKNMIKLIYNRDAEQNVEVKFSDVNGLIKTDKIKSSSFNHGFAKKYKVQRKQSDAFRVEVSSASLSVTYKITASRDGQWVAALENMAYQSIVAKR